MKYILLTLSANLVALTCIALKPIIDVGKEAMAHILSLESKEAS